MCHSGKFKLKDKTQIKVYGMIYISVYVWDTIK